MSKYRSACFLFPTVCNAFMWVSIQMRVHAVGIFVVLISLAVCFVDDEVNAGIPNGRYPRSVFRDSRDEAESRGVRIELDASCLPVEAPYSLS